MQLHFTLEGTLAARPLIVIFDLMDDCPKHLL